MGAKQERQRMINDQFSEQLQNRADELSAETRMGVAMSLGVMEDAEVTGKLDLNALVIANRRHERALTDAFWLRTLMDCGLSFPFILKLFEVKDEKSRNNELEYEE